MPAVKLVEDAGEFDMIPSSKPRIVQLVSLNGYLAVLMSDGRLMQRFDDNTKIGQPHGPHFAWREIAGPV